MLNDIIKEQQADFKQKYCVERGQIRWIRSIFRDDTDQIEKILEAIQSAAQAAYEAGRKEVRSIKISLPTEYEHSVKATDAYKEGFRKAIEMFKDRIDTLTPNDTI